MHTPSGSPFPANMPHAEPARRRPRRLWPWVLLLALGMSLGGLGVGYRLGQRQAEPRPTASPTEASVPYQAVVMLELYSSEGRRLRSASGTLIHPEGLILTCAHGVWPRPGESPETTIVVRMTDRAETPPQPRYRAQIVQMDPDVDLAVLRITHDVQGRPVDPAKLQLPFIPLGDPSTLSLGDPITILGYPGIGGSTITLSQGVVAGFVEQPPYGPRALIKTTAMLARGNSGGAALDRHGRLVAVPVQVGVGPDAPVTDCRLVQDTNHDGTIDARDTCVPVGGFLNTLRPVDLGQALIAAARQGRHDAPTPTAVATPQAPASASILLAHDTLVTPHWSWLFADEHGWTQFTEGVMWVSLTDPHYTQAFVLDMGPRDVDVQARFRVQNPVPGAYLGLTCRYQQGRDFYAFVLRTDGAYAILRYQVEGETYLVPWTASERPLRAGAVEELRIQCDGATLRFWRGEQRLAQAVDASLEEGDVGFLFGTLGQGGWVAGLDEYWIRLISHPRE
ncbi:MAG: trypsin-like peptidase domain-containing protein [Chloroflexi bacterium]|nr:trypsin-like peptidase domain-containing protein [Chloroflexota bacterium]